jgi:cytoskeletal protein CcmA (bactofilin family)
MFKRKDDDIDLLGETPTQDNNNTTAEKQEPKMNTTLTDNPSSEKTEAATSTAPATTAPVPTSAPAATPLAPASSTSATGGYVRPADSSRPSTFRPAGGAETAGAGRSAARPGNDFRSGGGYSPAANASSGSESNKNSGRRVLTVGNDILLKGEIATCDRLVIEGAVDATLNEVHTVEIAEAGSFKGSAEIEDAEISGEFDGELTVRGRLVVYSTGKVRGKITYGEVEIERGGQLTGTIKTYDADSVNKDKEKEKAAAKKAA